VVAFAFAFAFVFAVVFAVELRRLGRSLQQEATSSCSDGDVARSPPS
jgi:hypothetical protein